MSRPIQRTNYYNRGAVVLLVGGLCVSLYAVVVHPMLNIEKYKEIQRHVRKDIKQEEIQPGNMRVWSDPFSRR